MGLRGTRSSNPRWTTCYHHKAGGVRVTWSKDPVSAICSWRYGTTTGEDPGIGGKGTGSVQSVFVQSPRRESSLEISHFHRPPDNDDGRGPPYGKDVICCRLQWFQSYSGVTLGLPLPSTVAQESPIDQEPEGTGSL